MNINAHEVQEGAAVVHALSCSKVIKVFLSKIH